MGARKLILTFAAFALALIWIFPSWVYVWETPSFSFEAKIGSSWLWSPPMPYGVRLHWEKNLAYSLIVILVAQGAILWRRWLAK